jgi:N-carbamoylputrescine amidase
LQELFTSLYFCDVEDYDNFDLAEAIPGPSTNALSEVKELGVVIIASLFEKRAQGLYHNTTAILDADGTYLGKTEKCTFQMILLFTKNSISRQEI